MAHKNVLVLAANVRDMPHLKLSPEAKKIKSILGRRNVEICLDTTTDDIYDYLSEHRLPEIIHFCGHGFSDGLLVVDDRGKSHKIDTIALNGLFQNAQRKGVQCVILNTCYSEPVADAISQHVDFVIGMGDEVTDAIALHFSYAFYRALSQGRSYINSYRAGCDRIALESMKDSAIPRIKYKNKRHAAEEVTTIQKLWLQASHTVDLSLIKKRIEDLRRRCPQLQEVKELEARIRRSDRIMRRTPNGVLSSILATDAFLLIIIAIWVFLGIYSMSVVTLLPHQIYIVVAVFCLIGSYLSQVLYRFAWHSIRPSGTFQQVAIRSLLPDIDGLVKRTLLSGLGWIILYSMLISLYKDYGSNRLIAGGLLGFLIGISMVVLTLWELSLTPSQRKR